mmetsp:Transcript_33547/g.33000  ORF Transcript_33547/g.33000 Transcript_33547/m.33000 type:complete len:156 (-) Transcript_33547:28-495(-)|eukprot:CAMPEP_0196995596 /NCGR_PEP_ID=MMETSP1380-20130617/1680_1 /TAXON_ID=5936 /ORGANISM="Euplotes crassus, Strain CT5" /LENGTH=155 /DNA_ID=CAMNT_0042411301 /DNA_START=180 /DNA_END=647 /DNA_ORIENTATION=-
MNPPKDRAESTLAVKDNLHSNVGSQLDLDEEEEFKIEDDIKNERKDSYKKHLEAMHPYKIHKAKSHNFTGEVRFSSSQPQQHTIRVPQDVEASTCANFDNVSQGENANQPSGIRAIVQLTVEKKLHWLCSKLTQETDYDQIDKLLDLVQKTKGML